MNILRNRTDLNATTVAELLTIYYYSISISSFNESEMLTPSEVEEIVNDLNDKFIVCAERSYIIAQAPYQSNDMVAGALLASNYQNQVILNSNKSSIINSSFSAAAFFDLAPLSNVNTLKMLLIDKPYDYQHFTNSQNKMIVSPVIVTNVEQNNSLVNWLNVSLFFKLDDASNVSLGSFTCEHYDINTSSWNSTNCTSPTYNSDYGRYECSCIYMSLGKRKEYVL